MRPRASRPRRALNQRLFDSPLLLRDTPPLPRSRAQRLTLIRYHCGNLPGSVHLRSKWAPIWSVHFWRMTPFQPPVQTVTTGRLLNWRVRPMRPKMWSRQVLTTTPVPDLLRTMRGYRSRFEVLWS